MKLYAHQAHVYEDRANRRFYEWAVNQVRDVPDEIGTMLLIAHEPKFCDVSHLTQPETHVCKKTKLYEVRPFESPVTTELVPGTGRVSKQRLQLRRQTLKRSRVARANIAARS